jgi:predicted GNAT family N-acyltransferase
MNEIIISSITINDRQDYEEVYALREEILRRPIGLSLKDEDLSGDALDTIVIAKSEGTLIGCLMIHPGNNAHTLKLRQMGVAESWQRKGIGQLLVNAAEKLCWEKAEKIVLHARITAEAFYEKLGYKTVSDVFSEVGIPHVVMEKTKP